MKKLLLILLGVVIISVLAQKIGLLNYFSNNPNPVTKKQPTDTPPVKISPVINRPIIGVHYRMINKQSAIQNNLVEGAYITQIISGTLAEKVGLQEEDIITDIDGQTIAGLDQQSVYNLVSTLKSGAKVNLKIWRNKEIKNILVTLD